MTSLFEQNIRYLKGVGEKRARLFEKLGAPTVGALLRLYPRAYEDWSHPLPIAQVPFGEPCCVRAQIVSRISEARIRRGLTLYKFQATDGTDTMQVTLFNNPYLAKNLTEGNEYLFRGRLGGGFTHREMSAPQILPADSGMCIRPVYPQTEGLSSRQIESAVKEAIRQLPQVLEEELPSEVCARYRLLPLGDALRQIHFPASWQQMEQARRRFVFEELLLLQLGLFHLRAGRAHEATACAVLRDCSEEFFAALPFSPTAAQRRVVGECLGDMLDARRPMNRLVQGDVGSGKTAVAAALCHTAARNGLQCAVMAPTEILAEQHFRSLGGLLGGLGLNVRLLTGSTPAAARQELLSALQKGGIDVLIGTHALLSEGVRFHNLGLVVTDEQHRFGVGQRAALAQKGKGPHLLVMSATPIPRTLALMIYGDLDVSVIDELPPGRKTVQTFFIDSSKRKRAYRFVAKHLEDGLQGYVVCPLVEEGDSGMAAAEEQVQRLRRIFPQFRVGLLHGRLKPREKEAVMRAFAAGEIQLLVATTVVEVGVDVPRAVVMVVENAERFGLSQLHQLRGRVGRGDWPSYCILISDAKNEEAQHRLRVMQETTDGFRIAEEDLKQRGPGDFFGQRQHGLPMLSIADLMKDGASLREAQRTAKELLNADPDLISPEHNGLRQGVMRLFNGIGEGGFN
jgi:ATP-dependent DNA helicase RecG